MFFYSGILDYDFSTRLGKRKGKEGNEGSMLLLLFSIFDPVLEGTGLKCMGRLELPI